MPPNRVHEASFNGVLEDRKNRAPQVNALKSGAGLSESNRHPEPWQGSTKHTQGAGLAALSIFSTASQWKIIETGTGAMRSAFATTSGKKVRSRSICPMGQFQDVASVAVVADLSPDFPPCLSFTV
jgi:hypothetical protein